MKNKLNNWFKHSMPNNNNICKTRVIKCKTIKTIFKMSKIKNIMMTMEKRKKSSVLRQINININNMINTNICNKINRNNFKNKTKGILFKMNKSMVMKTKQTTNMVRKNTQTIIIKPTNNLKINKIIKTIKIIIKTLKSRGDIKMNQKRKILKKTKWLIKNSFLMNLNKKIMSKPWVKLIITNKILLVDMIKIFRIFVKKLTKKTK